MARARRVVYGTECLGDQGTGAGDRRESKAKVKSRYGNGQVAYDGVGF